MTLTLSLVTVVSVHAERDWVAKLAADLADPLTGLRSNSGVDIVAHRGGVWVGTTNGVSFTDDLGQTWFTYDETTGLNASNTSALFALGNRIWTATASTEVINGASQAVGQGVQFSDDGGFLWQTPLDINGTLAASTLGPVKTTFDISGDSATVFASSFVGGLIGSDDGGVSWKNFHATAEDAAWFAGPQNSQPPLTSRYFSVVVDTAHTDSVVVLAGHAGGVTRFDFISKRLKPSSVRTTDFAYSPADNYIFMAGESGLSRADAFGYSNWLSVFDSTVVGLPGNIINQVHFFGGRLFVGVVDSLDGDAIGFVSTDATLGSFSPVGPATVLDSVVAKPGAAVYDFDDFGNR
ncbi:MAG: hypothetical protein ACE5GA_07595, partial [Candidatus Zixiibacteriota bacterium]